MIITVDQFKAITGIQDPVLDPQIAALIPVVEEDYLAIRNKPFDTDVDGLTVYPAGSLMTAAEMVSYKLATLGGKVGATWEAIGGYSISLTVDLVQGYPKGTVSRIKRYGRAR